MANIEQLINGIPIIYFQIYAWTLFGIWVIFTIMKGGKRKTKMGLFGRREEETSKEKFVPETESEEEDEEEDEEDEDPDKECSFQYNYSGDGDWECGLSEDVYCDKKICPYWQNKTK